MIINSLRAKYKVIARAETNKQDILCITCNGMKNMHIDKLNSKIFYRITATSYHVLRPSRYFFSYRTRVRLVWYEKNTYSL